MFIYSLASLIPLTVLLALIVVSGRAIWLAVMPPRRCVREASCEKCKYPVAGLSTWTCPECGSHLLTVGIVTRAMEVRRRGSYAGAIVGLLTILFFGVVVGWIATEATLGWGMGMANIPTTVQTTTITPSSGTYASLKIEQIDDYTSSNGPYTAILHLDVAGQRHEMTINVFDDLSYTTSAPDGTTSLSGTCDVQSLIDWFEIAGIDATGEQTAVEIRELDSMIQQWPSNWTQPSPVDLPSFTITAKTMSTSSPTTPTESRTLYQTLMWAIPVVGLLLFGLFTVLIVRRRRKLLRDADRPAPLAVPAGS